MDDTDAEDLHRFIEDFSIRNIFNSLKLNP